jgi:hypothetical protein
MLYWEYMYTAERCKKYEPQISATECLFRDESIIVLYKWILQVQTFAKWDTSRDVHTTDGLQ